LALAPFGVLAHGNIRTDAEEQKRKETGDLGRTLFKPQWERTEEQQNMTRALEKVAQEVGAKSIHAVAIAYVMQKVPYCFPIIGGRKIETMLSNLEALDISLSHTQISYLESIIPFDPGFPHSMIVCCLMPFLLSVCSQGLSRVTGRSIRYKQAVRPFS
jgi:aryl-alcohol dehydrogenase-like predicted oxidoreductase